ncbi:uncharacterized protein MONBRDRAFT_36259 [Monosiga brevicollis MX1]|uniref:Arf-GAP domain-containing protein n=1 Tax=Monosiga brevicollis TaxID=81824 RepID=A9UU51_MONBE|nr:uncharacterized protein MONBRDRAFT_36259 [Monosiga brevicollis MX1]EDQ91361.1 predicted protein [Monosiga brevicollis MX1]|eukprot:XP_001743783.1 hypothetical protein [Monosiga brevicollis MX1]
MSVPANSTEEVDGNIKQCVSSLKSGTNLYRKLIKQAGDYLKKLEHVHDAERGLIETLSQIQQASPLLHEVADDHQIRQHTDGFRIGVRTLHDVFESREALEEAVDLKLVEAMTQEVNEFNGRLNEVIKTQAQLVKDAEKLMDEAAKRLQPALAAVLFMNQAAVGVQRHRQQISNLIKTYGPLVDLTEGYDEDELVPAVEAPRIPRRNTRADAAGAEDEDEDEDEEPTQGRSFRGHGSARRQGSYRVAGTRPAGIGAEEEDDDDDDEPEERRSQAQPATAAFDDGHEPLHREADSPLPDTRMPRGSASREALFVSAEDRAPARDSWLPPSAREPAARDDRRAPAADHRRRDPYSDRRSADQYTRDVYPPAQSRRAQAYPDVSLPRDYEDDPNDFDGYRLVSEERTAGGPRYDQDPHPRAQSAPYGRGPSRATDGYEYYAQEAPVRRRHRDEGDDAEARRLRRERRVSQYEFERQIYKARYAFQAGGNNQISMAKVVSSTLDHCTDNDLSTDVLQALTLDEPPLLKLIQAAHELLQPATPNQLGEQTHQRILQQAVCEHLQKSYRLYDTYHVDLPLALLHLFKLRQTYHAACSQSLLQLLPDIENATLALNEAKAAAQRRQALLVSLTADLQQQEATTWLEQLPGSHFAYIADVLNKPGNDACADCASPKPMVALCDLGILVCTGCAELHRQLCLAARPSFIGSTPSTPTPANPNPTVLPDHQGRVLMAAHGDAIMHLPTVANMHLADVVQLQHIGNVAFNEVFEARHAEAERARQAAVGLAADMLLFLQDKYVDLVFAEPPNKSDAKRHLQALVQSDQGRTLTSYQLLQDLVLPGLQRDPVAEASLVAAAASDNLLAVDFMLRNGVNVQAVVDGRTALHAAAAAGHVTMLRLLLRRNAMLTAINDRNLTPLLEAQARQQVSATYLLTAAADGLLPQILSQPIDFTRQHLMDGLGLPGRDSPSTAEGSAQSSWAPTPITSPQVNELRSGAVAGRAHPSGQTATPPTFSPPQPRDVTAATLEPAGGPVSTRPLTGQRARHHVYAEINEADITSIPLPTPRPSRPAPPPPPMAASRPSTAPVRSSSTAPLERAMSDVRLGGRGAVLLTTVGEPLGDLDDLSALPPPPDELLQGDATSVPTPEAQPDPRLLQEPVTSRSHEDQATAAEDTLYDNQVSVEPPTPTRKLAPPPRRVSVRTRTRSGSTEPTIIDVPSTASQISFAVERQAGEVVSVRHLPDPGSEPEC